MGKLIKLILVFGCMIFGINAYTITASEVVVFSNREYKEKTASRNDLSTYGEVFPHHLVTDAQKIGIPSLITSRGEDIEGDGMGFICTIPWETHKDGLEDKNDVQATDDPGDIGLGKGRTHPADLMQFAAKADNCDVHLEWQSRTKSQFSHYELERSSDGRIFGQIKIIEAQGPVDQSSTYNFKDQPTSSGDYYYRIKMVDLDGSFAYSEVINVEADCSKQLIAYVYPNPVSAYENLNLRLYTFQKEVEIAISNQFGQLAQQLTLKVDRGWNILSLDVAELGAGLYYMTLGGENPKRVKFIRAAEE
ncbi:MAG: T9SS type A sorting domain-containing protein [Bacteroidota bacterium]